LPGIHILDGKLIKLGETDDNGKFVVEVRRGQQKMQTFSPLHAPYSIDIDVSCDLQLLPFVLLKQ
jgi:hypothetical protein